MEKKIDLFSPIDPLGVIFPMDSVRDLKPGRELDALIDLKAGEEWLSKFRIGSHCSGHGDSSEHLTFSGSWDQRIHFRELLRLARLGLWAQERALPAMDYDGTDQRDKIKEALDELPSDS